MGLGSIILLFAATAMGGVEGPSLTPCSPEAGCFEDLAAAQRFDLADRYAAAADYAGAEAVLRELARHSTLLIRSEARFRLAMMLARLGRKADAAILLRQILDDDPTASRVRLELAQLLDQLGDDAGARKALREAQASGLPAEVALLVDRYSASLRARKPIGASLELTIAPDSNINRATRSASLGTVFGDLTLDRDARETSGVGLAARGQIYRRVRLSRRLNLLGKIAASADIYRARQFNDFATGFTLGPEVAVGAARFGADLGTIWRWRGNKPFSRTLYVSAGYLRPIDRRSQIRLTSAVGAIRNRLNDFESGRTYGSSISYERALSARSGLGITVSAERQKLRDKGYSTRSGQLSVFGYQEIGGTTVTATVSYIGLKADERLFLYPKVRKESLYRGSIAATFRKLAVGSFAPLVRLTVERNHSSLDLFDYRRLRTEVGIARAF